MELASVNKGGPGSAEALDVQTVQANARLWQNYKKLQFILLKTSQLTTTTPGRLNLLGQERIIGQ